MDWCGLVRRRWVCPSIDDERSLLRPSHATVDTTRNRNVSKNRKKERECDGTTIVRRTFVHFFIFFWGSDVVSLWDGSTNRGDAGIRTLADRCLSEDSVDHKARRSEPPPVPFATPFPTGSGLRSKGRMTSDMGEFLGRAFRRRLLSLTPWTNSGTSPPIRSRNTCRPCLERGVRGIMKLETHVDTTVG